MLFIGNGKVITRDGGAFFENGAVVTDGEKIVAVGDGAALRRQYPDAELIDAHGGTITVRSVPDKETVFTVSLPV